MDCFKGLILFLLLSLKASVVQGFNKYFFRNTSSILSPLFTACPMLGSQTGVSVYLYKFLFVFLGLDATPCSSALPLLPSSALRASLVLIGGRAGLQWGS